MFETLMSGISGAAGQATAWLLTYALHSTLFLALAWLASRRLSRRARLEEAVWRFALLAGLVTATVQLAAGWEPLAGRWILEAPAATSSDIYIATARELPAAPAPTIEVRATAPVQSLRQVPVAAPAWRVDLRTAALGLWAFGAFLLAMRWSWSYLRLQRRLRARPEVIGGGVFSLLGRLSGEIGLAPLVRLTCSSRVSVPVALGVLRPEICVPPRALSHLEPEQQEGMLAHELAHLVRRDPFWLAFSRLLSSIFFFQPLNRVAGRRLRELSERLCDEWAVERTGRPLSLARCLAEVAGWSVAPLRELPVPSMADRPSSLARRIRHLLDDARSPERRVKPLWLGVAMLAVLVAVAAAAPGVYAASKDPAPAEPGAAVEPAEAPEPAEAVEAAELADERDQLDEADLMDEGERLSEADQARLEEMSKRMASEAAEISAKYAKDYEALADRISNQMEPELERISEQVNREMAPEIERVSEQVNRDMQPEIERISEEVAERMSKLGPEIAKLQAEADRLRKEGKLSDEERERIQTQAREMARRARPSDEEMKALREAQQSYRDEMRKLLEEHREEIEAVRREIRLQADAMRDQARRQLEADPKLREIRARGEGATPAATPPPSP
jgi:beta-lactamase regulating signal transducer with metallopeptidase domain/F0F1-type ATP synthase membrane subunit b/b'